MQRKECPKCGQQLLEVLEGLSCGWACPGCNWSAWTTNQEALDALPDGTGSQKGAGLFSGDPAGDPAGVPCDPDRWSEESRRSVAYEFAPRVYRDKGYRCWRCGVPDVYKAADQKHAFEVRQVNISQERILCGACQRERVGLERAADDHRRRWTAERSALLGDPEFLRRWLDVLEALPGYAGARDEANITVLRRLLGPSG